ncbi:hypothetical protein C0992_007965 [Termitomyces sp. T32_za158]|nr:hypothetical protein C0992_007965 [Termitomyces sp. T32_za158]
MDPTPSVPTPFLFSLKGKNVLITGATRGIGAACAIALAEAGASVCLVQRNPSEGTPPNHETLNAIRALGAVVEVVYCDLDNMEAVKDLFQMALDVMGGQIHILVNCAGIQRRSPSLQFSESDWDDVRVRRAVVRTMFYPPTGDQCEPQVSVVALPGGRKTHGSSPSRKNH